MPVESLEPLTDALSAPLGELIAAVGRGVGDAQQAMDARTIELVRALAAASGANDALTLLRQIGYQPTWYQIPEVTAELTVALTVTGSGTESAGASPPGRLRVLAAPVDAAYTNRYGYELKAASTVRFRIVPIPPTARAEQLRAVPAVVGLTFGAAQARLAELDVPWQLASGASAPDASAFVAKQVPEPGALLTGDSAVELSF